MFDDLKREPTADEKVFAEELAKLVPDLQVWLHNDPDATPWMMISYDVFGEPTSFQPARKGWLRRRPAKISRRRMIATLRLDFDEHSIIGGRSPAFLNWDAEMRAHEAGISGDGSDELTLPRKGASLQELADQAAQWFSRRIKELHY